MKSTHEANDMAELDGLALRLASMTRTVRLEALLGLIEFERRHGQEKCKAMVEELKRRAGV